MRTQRGSVLLAVLCVGMLPLPAITQGPSQKSDKPTVDATIATWKAKPREVAQKIIAKYGQPDEVTRVSGSSGTTTDPGS